MRNCVSAIAAAALLAVATTPVTAAAQSQTATGQKSEAAKKKVCRWIEPRTGSLIKERICLTAQDWKKVEQLLAE